MRPANSSASVSAIAVPATAANAWRASVPVSSSATLTASTAIST